MQGAWPPTPRLRPRRRLSAASSLWCAVQCRLGREGSLPFERSPFVSHGDYLLRSAVCGPVLRSAVCGTVLPPWLDPPSARLWPYRNASPRTVDASPHAQLETPYPNRNTAKPMAMTQLMSVRPMVHKQPRSITSTCSLSKLARATTGNDLGCTARRSSARVLITA